MARGFEKKTRTYHKHLNSTSLLSEDSISEKRGSSRTINEVVYYVFIFYDCITSPNIHHTIVRLPTTHFIKVKYNRLKENENNLLKKSFLQLLLLLLQGFHAVQTKHVFLFGFLLKKR